MICWRSGNVAVLSSRHECLMEELTRVDLPGGDRDVAVLGNLLVGLLGSTGGDRLNSLSDVVGTLLDGLHCDSGWLFEGWFGLKCCVD